MNARDVALRAGPGVHRWCLAAIAVSFVALAAAYSLATPLGEGPDEPGHVAYVQFLLAQHRLPRHGEVDEPLKQQVKHPPLYYLLGALVTAWADYGGLRFYPNPQFGVNFAHMEVLTAHRHFPEEQWPWAPRYLAARALRLLSVLLGLAVVLATYATARVVLPDEPWLAVAAAATAAYLPQFLFMSGVANNDALANAAAATATLAAVRVATGATRRRDLAFLGAAVGVAVLAKLTTLALLAVAGLAVILAARQARAWRVAARGAVWAGGTWVLVAGWWFARNAWVNGDLLGWGGFTRAAVANARTRPLAIDLADYFRQQGQSFFGRFGWMAVPLPEGWYRALALLGAVAALGLVVLLVRHRRPRAAASLLAPPAGLGVTVLVATVALVYASVFRLAFAFDLVVAQGRYLYTGLAAGAVLFVLGLVGWWPAPRRPWGALAVAGSAFLLAVAALAAVLVPAFAPPGLVTASELAGLPNRVDVAFGQSVRLEGYAMAAERVAPGETVAATLYFRPVGQPPTGLNLGFGLADGRGDGPHEQAPGAGTYPATSWVAGRAWREVVRLGVPPASAGASPLRSGLVLSWYPAGWAGEPLPVRVDGAAAGHSFTLGPLYIVPAGPPDPARTPWPRGDAWRTAATAPPALALRSVGVARRLAAPGPGLTVTLRWQARATLPDDMTVFVHADGPDGRPVATADGDPAGLPARLWRPGDDFAGDHVLDLAGLAPGDYPVRVGLYHRGDGRRLAASDPRGAAWPDGAATLGGVTVGPGGVRFTPAAAAAEPAPGGP